jgi:hypothetical protein
MGHWHGHGHHGGSRHAWGCGPESGFRGQFNREEWLRRLEEYQRNLEQRVADVADLIRRLKEEGPPKPTETATV